MFEQRIKKITDKIKQLQNEKQAITKQILNCKDVYKNSLAQDHYLKIETMLIDLHTELKVWLNNEPVKKIKEKYKQYLEIT